MLTGARIDHSRLVAFFPCDLPQPSRRSARCCRARAMLPSVSVALWRTLRLSAVHPASAIRHCSPKAGVTGSNPVGCTIFPNRRLIPITWVYRIMNCVTVCATVVLHTGETNSRATGASRPTRRSIFHSISSTFGARSTDRRDRNAQVAAHP